MVDNKKEIWQDIDVYDINTEKRWLLIKMVKMQ